MYFEILSYGVYIHDYYMLLVCRYFFQCKILIIFYGTFFTLNCILSGMYCLTYILILSLSIFLCLFLVT